MNLGNLARAEQSARKTIDVDTHSEFPRAYMVLGTILLQQNDSRGAIAAFRNFVKAAPPGWETTLVKSWVAWLDSAHSVN